MPCATKTAAAPLRNSHPESAAVRGRPDTVAGVDTDKDVKPISLTGATRAGSIALGALFLGLPVAAYFDTRLGLVGTSDQPQEAFGLVMAIFVVLGGVLVVSGIIGMWLMWKDVAPLSDSTSPDLGRVASFDPVAASAGQHADLSEGSASLHGDNSPPFPGQQREVDLLEADTAFVDAAKSYYDEMLSTGTSFSKAVTSVWRSKHGRPNYYFQVTLPSGEIRWIRVPHRGKAGGGAGTAGEDESQS
jgi:hypothetical protein